MKNLQISETNARKLYRTATPEFKQMLEDTFGKEYFTGIPTHLWSYEDCCEFLGKKPLDFAALKAAGATNFGIKSMIQETIVEAINNRQSIDLFDANQKKWQPYFNIGNSSSGFAFGDTVYGYSGACAGGASRLCFVDEPRAKFYGERFLKYIKDFMIA